MTNRLSGRNMQTGEGWKDLVYKGLAKVSNIFPDANEDARPVYPGELHALGRCGNLPCRSAYTGPGTVLALRLRRKPRGKTYPFMAGDPPRNPTDVVSRRHDLSYGLSTSPADIRAADKRMLSSLKKIRKNKSDSVINTGPAYAGIAAKVKAEDFGLLSKTAFIDNVRPSKADRELYQTELDKMAQHGLGERKRPGEVLLKNLGKHILKSKKRRRRR